MDKVLPAVAAPFLPSLREFTTQKEADKAEMSIKKCFHFWESFWVKHIIQWCLITMYKALSEMSSILWSPCLPAVITVCCYPLAP